MELLTLVRGRDLAPSEIIASLFSLTKVLRLFLEDPHHKVLPDVWLAASDWVLGGGNHSRVYRTLL